MSEALRLLIGAIAHDFRNHMTVIQCWSDVLVRPGALLKDKAAGYVQNIRGATACAIQLTEQLLAFSDPQHANPKVVNLDVVINDVVKLAAGAMDENIHLRVVDCSDLGMVRLDYGRFQEALLTVILNARDSMPQGGEIIVTGSTIVVDAMAATNSASASPGHNVLVTIASIESGSGKETTIEMHLPRITGGDLQEANA